VADIFDASMPNHFGIVLATRPQLSVWSQISMAYRHVRSSPDRDHFALGPTGWWCPGGTMELAKGFPMTAEALSNPSP
jgi:hypothetical protein